MSEPRFFAFASSPTVADVVAWTGARAAAGTDTTAVIRRVAPLESSAPGDLTFLDNAKYAPALATTRATACLLAPRFAPQAPARLIALVSSDPYRAMAVALTHLYPGASRPASMFGATGVSPGTFVHPDAHLEDGVVVDPGAVIGPGAAIGAGSIIGANAVIGPSVHVGRLCAIGAHVTLQHALLGDRVIVHPGARIGQDGFGFAMGRAGHLKVPQVGRVIIQNDVEIGANATIDRGANRDTMIGEGTKIDNLVQIGHNVRIGRHCVIVAQAGISGSTDVGDFAAMGGQVGLTGHLKIGAGARIAAGSGVMHDVPPGERWMGAPAQPLRDFVRGRAELDRLAKGSLAARPHVDGGEASDEPEKRERHRRAPRDGT